MKPRDSTIKPEGQHNLNRGARHAFELPSRSTITVGRTDAVGASDEHDIESTPLGRLIGTPRTPSLTVSRPA